MRNGYTVIFGTHVANKINKIYCLSSVWDESKRRVKDVAQILRKWRNEGHLYYTKINDYRSKSNEIQSRPLPYVWVQYDWEVFSFLNKILSSLSFLTDLVFLTVRQLFVGWGFSFLLTEVKFTKNSANLKCWFDTFIYCNMVTTMVLANTSNIPCNYHFSFLRWE